MHPIYIISLGLLLSRKASVHFAYLDEKLLTNTFVVTVLFSEYESEICRGSLQNLAICASPSSVTGTQRKNSRGVSGKQNGWKHTSINSNKVAFPSNRTSSTRKERVVRENNDDDDTASSGSLVVTFLQFFVPLSPEKVNRIFNRLVKTMFMRL